MARAASASLSDLLAPRCVACSGRLGLESGAVNFGDLQYHRTCQPACSVCERPLGGGEGGWRSEGQVVSAPWGYSVRPTRFWCPDCLGSAPRDDPRGVD